MPEICVFPGCPNKRVTGSKTNVSFHRIPREQPLRSKWLKAIGKPKWDPSIKTTICGDHFKEEEFFMPYPGQKRLVKTAVPTTPAKAGKDPESVAGKRKRAASESPNKKDDDRPSKRFKSGESAETSATKKAKNLPNVVKNNEKETQTSAGDWSRLVKNTTQKSVQVNLAEKIEKKLSIPIHCTTTEEHKARHRIDILLKELDRLGEIKNKQHHVIKLLKRKYKTIAKSALNVQEIVLPDGHKSNMEVQKKQTLPRAGLTVMGTSRKTYMEQSESSLPVVYVSNMDVQCSANSNLKLAR